jgi:cytochrome c oxidase assembly protein subunit 11
MATRTTRTVSKLLLLVVGMFGFGFALIPIYDLICEVTGLGGRTGGAYVYDPATMAVDRSRLVKVNFITNTNDGMPWEFRAEQGAMRVRPGELAEAMFHVYNPTDRPMIGQAIPSVVPVKAVAYFHKTECFCFQQQTLAPGQSMAMPMRFVVDPDLPRDVQSISLGYALFDVTDRFVAIQAAGSDSNPG